MSLDEHPKNHTKRAAEPRMLDDKVREVKEAARALAVEESQTEARPVFFSRPDYYCTNSEEIDSSQTEGERKSGQRRDFAEE